MLSEEYDNLPQQIKDIVDSFDDNQDLYKECERVKSELNEVGYTCDYGLSGEVYDVRVMDTFNDWVNSDNVVEENGVYLTQCTQYRKKFTRTQLNEYYNKEYLNN